jgi:hypothetical protein
MKETIILHRLYGAWRGVVIIGECNVANETSHTAAQHYLSNIIIQNTKSQMSLRISNITTELQKAFDSI